MKRLPVVDALRGFALFGILVVNIQYFAHPLGTDLAGIAAGPLDLVATWLTRALFESKFYVLFSFLFGFGLAVQVERAADDPRRLRPQYWRRLAGLFALGVVHAMFFFAGDILVSYALLGFVLWRLREWDDWRLERFALGMIGVGCALSALTGLSFAVPTDAVAGTDIEAAALQSIEAYRGHFADAVSQRLRDLQLIYLAAPLLTWPTALALFVLGLVAGRNAMFSAPSRLMELARLRWWVGIAVAGNIAHATFAHSTEHPWLAAASFAALPLAGPLLALVYVRLLWAFIERRPQALLTRALEAAGRLSLTNYLGQAVICSFIFTGYGLQLFGRLGAAALLALAVAIFALQLLFSLFWLRFVGIGPAEWLLRSLTYLRWYRP